MTYPGNSTLTPEMQDRILSTFQQTLTAAAAGNRQEAKLGCDFILRLDSLFGPARELLERLADGEGPVVTADLAQAAGLAAAAPATPAAAAAAPEPVASEPTAPPTTAAGDPLPAAAAQPPDIDDLSDLDLEMGLSDPLPPPVEPPPVEPPPVAPAIEMPAVEVPAAETPPVPPPAAAAVLPEVDELDDLDLGLDVETSPEPAAPAPPQDDLPAAPPEASAEPLPAAAPIEPAPDEAPPIEPPPMEAPPIEAPPIEAPPIEAPPSEPPPIEPPPPAEPTDEPPPPANEPAIEAAAEPPLPAADDASGLDGLDDLDDLDLSVAGADTGEPPVEEPPAPEAEPAEEPSLTAAEEAPTTEEAPAAEEPAETAAPPLAPQSVEIPLDSEPAARLDNESQQRIDDLLAEGQDAFAGGEYQGAIDAWSRIFLIDIDHAEANRRIEEARKLKAEADRKVEEKFHEGLAQLESGDTDAAAHSFRAVLEMQPSHLQARDYLEKLEAGEVPVPAEMPKPAEADTEPGDVETAGEADETPKPRPDRGTKAVGERVVSVKKSPFKSKGFLAVAGAGLIAVLAGGWYLFDNWSSLFPNSGQEEPAAAATDPVERAKGLHAEGKTPIAIAQLRRLPPDSPSYDEAQALIAQWELEQAPAQTGPGGPSPQELDRRAALIAEANAAADQREFMRVSELLSEAATVAPLSGTEVQLLARADEQLQELQNFITIFREGEWDLGLRDLWLLHESDPGNRDVIRLLVDSYYNLGLRALQRKDLKIASEQFKEALELSPDDLELLRLADFATTYQTRSTDLLYRIYVKYHPFR